MSRGSGRRRDEGGFEAELGAVSALERRQDNIHVDPPPVTKMPKFIKKLLDDWADEKKRPRPQPPVITT